MRLGALGFFATVVLNSTHCQCATSVSDDKPNIVILFADNLGYADISFFSGHSPRTPNVDRLGKEGIRLDNWNSAAHLCSASRAALLTGKYPVRTGIYPGVFHNDAAYGLLPTEKTIAEFLQEEGYSTSIIGKWHLGHNKEFLPTTSQGFDEWIGIPYHASGGSVENHICNYDKNETMWLPLYDGEKIVQQPARMGNLAQVYSRRAERFIERNKDTPFFLYMAFSHVHQLCAPRDFPEQSTCQWSGTDSITANASFADAVEEMDWIAGRILSSLDENGLANNTFVLFTSDNGPWVAEQSCSGSKGPFEGRWLSENVAPDCTACPHDYVPSATPQRPHRCILPGTPHNLDGVHCGRDTGLGSVWEANLRMPALARFPGRIKSGTTSSALVSTLDVVPTVLSIVGKDLPSSGDLDGVDISPVLYGTGTFNDSERLLFFWRDGFPDGPLKPPYGHFDVVAVKVGRNLKAWLSTKSAHYNDDVAVKHDPPLLFDVIADPAEASPLDPKDHAYIVAQIPKWVEEHKARIDWTFPLALFRDSKYIPCVDVSSNCTTIQEINTEAMIT